MVREHDAEAEGPPEQIPGQGLRASIASEVSRVEFRAQAVIPVRYVLDLTCNPDEPSMEWRFVEGEVGTVHIPQVGAALRRLHDGPSIPSRFDSFRVVEAYRAIAEDRGVGIPPVYDRASELAGRIERRRREEAQRPCHNDLLDANFIAEGNRLWIVDWEYAGMGDPFFDLGNFAVNHELDTDGERVLLESYGSRDGEALVLMRFMSDFREAMWGVAQQAISTLEFDFRAYGDEHFERLERTAAEPRFRAALD